MARTDTRMFYRVLCRHLPASIQAKMKIAILDDYQDAVRKLDCFTLLANHDVKVFNNTVRGIGQLSSRLAETEALVLIRERTRVTAQLLDKLPKLRVISQTGRVGSGHIDIDACTERGIVVLEGKGSPVAPAELTWALIMSAQRRIPQYVANLKQGAWQQSGLKTSSMPANFGLGQVLRGQTLGVWGYGKIGQLVAGYGRAFGMNVIVWGREHSLNAASKDGYEVATSQGLWRCRKLVIASGACNLASIPSLSAGLPAKVASITPQQYRNPGLLPEGGVMIVGGSASGIQLAREIHATGRRVVLSVGEHVRMPRTYRGRDIQWWMDAIGAMDVRYDTIFEDIERARRLPSPQLIGTPERVTVDLNSLRKAGVELVGRLVGLRDGKAQFSGSLANHCALADLKMNRLLASIDDWVSAKGFAERFPAPHRYEPTDIGPETALSLDLTSAGIATVIWATGYRPDYYWLDVPVLDRKGRIRHDGGVVPAPGMYVMGLPFMRRRKSSFIDGAGDDAADLAAHLTQNLVRAAA